MAKKKIPKTRPRARKAAPAGPRGFLREMGTLRIVLWLGTLLVMLTAPRPGTPAVYSGWAMWSTLFTPVLAPILLQVLLLDALMGRVLLTDAKGEARGHYRRVIGANLVLSAVLAVYWVPYYLALARG